MPIVSDAPIRSMLWEKMYGAMPVDPNAAASGQKRIDRYQTAKTLEAQNHMGKLSPSPVAPIREEGEDNISFNNRQQAYELKRKMWEEEKQELLDNKPNDSYNQLVREGTGTYAGFENSVNNQARRNANPLPNLTRDGVQSGGSTYDPGVMDALRDLLTKIGSMPKHP